MTRKDFLTKGLFGIATSLFAITSIASTVKAAPTVTTNQSGSACHVGTTAPSNVGMLWIDTSTYTPGVLKYYNGSDWVPSTATWS